MEPTKKLTFLVFATLLILVSGTISAYNCCATVCLDDTCTRWCGDYPETAPLHHAMPASDLCLFAGGEYLFWTAHQNELDYAQVEKLEIDEDDDDGALALVSDGTVRFADYTNCSGWRAFAGFKWGCDGWAIRGVWTEIDIDGGGSSDADKICPILLHPALAIEVLEDFTSADAKLKLRYRTIDALLEHPMCMTWTFIMKPFFGFRYIEIDQSFDAVYKGLITRRDVNWRGEYKGYGMYAGTGWSVCLGDCVGCGVATLNGHFGGVVSVGDAETSLQHSSLLIDFIELEHQNKWINVPGLIMGADLAWETCICGNFFQCSVGYEFNQYFNLPQVRRFTNDTTDLNLRCHASGSNHGNIAIHGLTAKLEFHF